MLKISELEGKGVVLTPKEKALIQDDLKHDTCDCGKRKRVTSSRCSICNSKLQLKLKRQRDAALKPTKPGPVPKTDKCACGRGKRTAKDRCSICNNSYYRQLRRVQARKDSEAETVKLKPVATCDVCKKPVWTIFEWCGIDLCSACAFEMARRKLMDDSYEPLIKVIG